MKAKIIIVFILALLVVGLGWTVINPDFVLDRFQKSESLKPKTETGSVLKYKSSKFPISFDYPSEYEISESDAENVYGSDTAVTFAFQGKSVLPNYPASMTMYSFKNIKTIGDLIELLRSDYPDIHAVECFNDKTKECTLLLTSSSTSQPPFHYVVKHGSGLGATKVQFKDSEKFLYTSSSSAGLKNDAIRTALTTLEYE